MTIKDKNKDIDYDLLTQMEVEARNRVLEAAASRYRTMRIEGIKHDEKMANIEIIPYRSES